MQINLVELWHSMGLPVRCVVILLTLQAIACVAVVLDRLLLLIVSSRRAQAFAAAVQPALEASAYDQVIAEAGSHKGNHLASYLEAGLRTFVTRRASGDDTPRAAELAKRTLERKGDAISRDLNRGMNILASTGSTAPFVGLLGTVLGIINAFKLISTTGSGGIGTIGAAIAEALVVTGYGLVVAIPSVLVFNFLSARIANYEAGLFNAGSELTDRLETSVDQRPVAVEPIRNQQPQMQVPMHQPPVRTEVTQPPLRTEPQSAPPPRRPFPGRTP
jgi:biopolymer transport protein ExbB/TolQ